MSRFDKYFLLKIDDVAEYVQEKLSFFPADAKFECKEIGDGNLNYVFRIVDTNTGKSIIVKQAGEATRISAEMKLSTDRGELKQRFLVFKQNMLRDLFQKYTFTTRLCVQWLWRTWLGIQS
jgi:5-methylthioribose kinase